MADAGLSSAAATEAKPVTPPVAATEEKDALAPHSMQDKISPTSTAAPPTKGECKSTPCDVDGEDSGIEEMGTESVAV